MKFISLILCFLRVLTKLSLVLLWLLDNMDYAKNIYIKSLGSQENRNKNADIRRLMNFDLKVIVYMVSKYLWKRDSLINESASHPPAFSL